MIHTAQDYPEEFPEELFQRRPLDDVQRELEEKLEELGNPESLTTEQITREYKRTGDGSPFLFTS